MSRRRSNRPSYRPVYRSDGQPLTDQHGNPVVTDGGKKAVDHWNNAHADNAKSGDSGEDGGENRS